MALWGAAIAAIIGPLFGVYVANIFSKQESKRRAAAELFSRLTEHAYNYFHIASQYNVAVALNPRAQLLVQQAAAGNDATFKKIAADAMQTQQQILAESFQRIAVAKALLNADTLSLELLFGERTAKCKSIIDGLLARGLSLNDKFDEKVLEAMGRDVIEIVTELKVLSLQCK